MTKRITQYLLAALALIVATGASAQQWGLYTFYGSMNGSNALLIDTAGTTYKTWSLGSTKKYGYSGYIIPGDTIVRSISRTGNLISGGGVTGEVCKMTWDGTIVWDYVLSDATQVLHHDICPLANGNVLVIVYDMISPTVAQEAGVTSYTNGVKCEKILELKPDGPTGAIVVWEWKLWDHICEEVNDSYNTNYVSDILDHPELMDINVGSASDRFHMNGIDYDPVLDQIVVSMHEINEIFVIDHSTTTAEAASHSGGNSGKGGDFLYRWGCPSNYGAAGTTIFDVVHDAHFVSRDHPNFPGYIAAFNNGGGTNGKAAITLINPPRNGYTYDITPGQAFAPSAATFQYNSTLTSNGQSNSVQLPNGNFHICNTGMFNSTIYETNAAGTTIWTKSINGSVAQAQRYDKCYIRGPMVDATASSSSVNIGSSVDVSCTAFSPSESSPTYSYSWSTGETTQSPSIYPDQTGYYYVTVTNTAVGCSATDSVYIEVLPTGYESPLQKDHFSIYPNPSEGIFNIDCGMCDLNDINITILDICGRTIAEAKSVKSIDMSSHKNGIYYMVISSIDTKSTFKIVLLK
jgi:hypothetical protein